ncbi:hypothetical protein SKAU_G00171490 [Synaphobranchus kaupii]|uniref:Uncharacterized protein n=1 Tax=Synaphobranchus kaupii TaxID=118154 RepID=A0A9Q1FKZ8_SYNKA|nr:hypothetical protein SKAU_G00171490 [Synaphobranchus kaupii]
MELERSIGELTRREARRAWAMTSPEWQTPAVRVCRRPDGFSGRQDNSASGPALEAILDLPPAERQNRQALTAALQRRFIQHRSAEASREKLLSRYRCEESWGKVAADVQRYAREVYPEFNAASAQEKLAFHAQKHAFLRVLTPEPLRDHVSLAQPGSISEALVKITRAEDILVIRPTPQPTRQHVTVADGEEVRWTRTPLQRPAGRPAPVAKIPAISVEASTTAFIKATEPATSAEASTSAFKKATEHKFHPRVGRLGKASGLYLHCRLGVDAHR